MGAKNIIILVLGLLLAIGVGAALTAYLGGGFDFAKEESYHAIQMENGDLYFGKVTRFPRFSLRDVYIVQSVQDPTNPLGSSLKVVSLIQATIWKADKIELNRDKIISISKVAADSEVLKAIKGQ